ncbi:MAG: response regulator transcription factor [Thermoflexaceae bacterium]|nr:response regulator transcription factor [Thermoflexaceae bacterium]
MVNILVVDDEFPIANLIKETLENAGYSCRCAHDGESAATEIENGIYDLVLLDVMLPKIDGFELIDYIRQYQIPVIFLTAKTDVKDRVKGLRLGAEDYIIKPFDVAELVARVEVVLRRFNKYSEIINILDLTIDTVSRSVVKAGIPVELTYKEFELLLLLVKNKNVALYREIIYEKVWKDPFCEDTRTVDLHIQRLRKKLGMEKNIQTVFKVGYRFVEEVDS